MEKKVLLRIAYVGTAYCGYQVQPNGPTVQEALNRAARALFGFECDVVGCSRTDSGVHAHGFAATVSKKGEAGLPTSVAVSRIPRAMNAHLPTDISVLEAREVDADFHARYDVVSKEYVYQFYVGRERNPFFEERAWHLHLSFDEERLVQMQQAAAAFVGTHDFSAFRAVGADTAEKDATRTVFAASVTRKQDTVFFRVRADGFLYNMVRIMAGTLAAVAAGDIAPDAIGDILAGGDRRRAGKTAPACGLYLDRVFYSFD